MMNFFTITAAAVAQCEFSINMQIEVESFNSESIALCHKFYFLT